MESSPEEYELPAPGALARVDAFTLWAEEAENLDGLLACAAESVRQPGVEFGGLAGTDDEIVIAQDEAEPSGEHVEPFVAFVNPQVRLAQRGRDDHFPGLERAGLTGHGQDGTAVHPARLEAHARVADLGRPHQFLRRRLRRRGGGRWRRQSPWTPAGAAAEAHRAASVYMLDHADELWTVWDGQPVRGYGGAADVITYAHEHNIPST